MRTDEMAKSYLRRAESRRIAAKAALDREAFPDVVRYSQEVVEMSLKAVLRAVGIEYPRDHEVSTVLLAEKKRLPPDLADDLARLTGISSKLLDARGPAMYGDEESGIPPEELFNREDAEASLRDARDVYRTCQGAIDRLFE
jgi:HEPN domain-containing protein